MMRIRVPIMALWTAGMVVSVAASAMADMYYYRDRNGQLHLTNVLSTVPSTYRSSVIKAEKSQGRVVVSTPEQRDQEAREQVLQSGSAAVVPEDAAKMTRLEATGSHAAPVSTHQFGLLQLRMTDFEVLQRLGQPAAITAVGSPASDSPALDRVIRVVRGEIWYYPGSESVPPTRLEFSNGLLVHKQRLRR